MDDKARNLARDLERMVAEFRRQVEAELADPATLALDKASSVTMVAAVMAGAVVLMMSWPRISSFSVPSGLPLLLAIVFWAPGVFLCVLALCQMWCSTNTLMNGVTYGWNRSAGYEIAGPTASNQKTCYIVAHVKA